jgi:coenzyme PQQ precursor peptide PqqA
MFSYRKNFHSEYEIQLQLSPAAGSLACRWQSFRPASIQYSEELLMQWEAPDFVEISVGCEINSYATAEI